MARRQLSLSLLSLMSIRDTSGNLLWSNIPGLSTLELQFETRKKLDESSTTTVQPQALADMRQELLCPICLDVMENVMVAKCLHRYCKDCIDKHLRQVDQKRECPLCRIHLATNRSLRKDDAMDAIVNLLYARKGRDKKRHRDNDDYCPEVSVVRDGARRHREQVTLMKEKQRIRLLSMEAVQRTKAQQESALRREERRDQLLPILPIVPLVPNNNTPLPLPVPLPLPSANTTASIASTGSSTSSTATATATASSSSFSASSSSTSSNPNKIVINDSTTATSTDTATAVTTTNLNNGAASGDLRDDRTQNLNGKNTESSSAINTEESSSTINTERRIDEKIEWAEMKTTEELEVPYEFLKNIPQNEYSSSAIEHSYKNTEYSGIKDPRYFNNETKLSYSAAELKEEEQENDVCEDRKLQNSECSSCVPNIRIECSDLLTANISHSDSTTNENYSIEKVYHVNGNNVVTVFPGSTVNSNNRQNDRNFVISSNNCQIRENGCIKITEFDINNYDNNNDKMIDYQNGNNCTNDNHNNSSSGDCSGESDCYNNVDFNTENYNGNNYYNENNENNENGENDENNNHDHDNNINNDNNDNNINNDNMPCHSENMIVEDTRSGVTSVDSNDDQEEDEHNENNESARKMYIEKKNIASKLSLKENDSVDKCVRNGNDDIENELHHDEYMNEDENGNNDDDDENEDGVEFIRTEEKPLNLDFQKRIFTLKKDENGNFSRARKAFFSVTVKRHGEEFQLPKIENTVFETFDNDMSATVQDVKDYLLHQFSLLNITTLNTTSMSLSRNMITLSMILPSENKNDKSSSVEEFKLSFDGTLTWQIARLLREKGLQLVIFYQLDTTLKSLSSSSSLKS